MSSSRRRVDHFQHHENNNISQALHSSLLTDIKNNTANIKIDTGDIDLNTDGLETLIGTTNTKLAGGLPSALTGSGHLSISIDEIGNTGSEKLNVNLDTQISQHFPTALSGSGRLKVESHITDHSKESKQDTAIGHLSNIDTGIDNIEACVAANKVNVNISSGSITGFATESTLNDAEVHLGSIDGKVIACNTGAVTISASALPSGAATQSTLNDAEVHLGNIETSVQLIDDAIVTDDAAITLGSQKGLAIMGFAGTQSVNANDAAMLACSTAGRLEVDVKNIVSTAITNTTLTNLNNCIGTNELQHHLK